MSTARPFIPSTRRTTLEGNQPMRPKRKKDLLPASPPPMEVSDDDRLVLAGAYKAGLIHAWKRDTERGYCLAFVGRQDEYVEVKHLTKYLETLRAR